MVYSAQEVMQYVKEEDVKFIRLAFAISSANRKHIHYAKRTASCLVSGTPLTPRRLPDLNITRSDLFLHPDPTTLAVLPWRPEHGRVVRMFCSISHSDGRIIEGDTRSFLVNTIEAAKKAGVSFAFGSEMEFYLFKLDERGNPTKEPYDNAGYMDIAPEDKGENVRREICLTLEQMGIYPESSHHEEGPGQNEIDFRYSDPLSAADNTITFQAVVKAIAQRNGLYADFSPKPLPDKPGNGFH